MKIIALHIMIWSLPTLKKFWFRHWLASQVRWRTRRMRWADGGRPRDHDSSGAPIFIEDTIWPSATRAVARVIEFFSSVFFVIRRFWSRSSIILVNWSYVLEFNQIRLRPSVQLYRMLSSFVGNPYALRSNQILLLYNLLCKKKNKLHRSSRTFIGR